MGCERRDFLRNSLCVAAVFSRTRLRAGTSPEQITQSISVVRGPVNGVLIKRRGGDLAIYGDPRDVLAAVKVVFFTHYRRDVVWAGRKMVRSGAEAVAPHAEKEFFTGVAAFWDQYRTARFHDYANQSSRILAEPMPLGRTVRGGDTIEGIEVLDTPGYTRGAVSYLIEIEGKRIACTGDLIYGDGRILDLFSLQDALPDLKENGYHGYAARAAGVVASLQKIAAWEPDVLIPARGPLIRNPSKAIDTLIHRLKAVFASHFAIDAMRYTRGDDKTRALAARVLGPEPVEWMPMAEKIEATLPDWLIAITNSRLIISRRGAAFLIDCGNERVVEEIRRLKREGRIKQLDGIYITHYHDDHTDMAQATADEFRCSVYFCSEMRDVLERPEAYRMPCLTTKAIRSGHPMREGAHQRWNEFEFTYSYFPGQTLYHGGLLVRHDSGQQIFFLGDSFTPSGMDDYCLLNRNFFPPETGYLNCLDHLRSLKGEYMLVNQHIAPAFRFSEAQLAYMTSTFTKRKELLAASFPWDDPNFGIDEQWARFYPYTAEVTAGGHVELEVIVRNHSAETRDFRVTPHAPPAWQVPAGPLRVAVPARDERSVRVPVTVGPPGLGIVTADIAFGDWEMREWTEAIVTVK